MATFIVALWKCNEAMCENLAVHFEEQPNDAIISIANYASGSAGSYPGFKPSHTLFLYLLSSLKLLHTYACTIASNMPCTADTLDGLDHYNYKHIATYICT